jgi:hypothetical protein
MNSAETHRRTRQMPRSDFNDAHRKNVTLRCSLRSRRTTDAGRRNDDPRKAQMTVARADGNVLV